MTLPRRLKLSVTPQGLRLVQKVDPGAAVAFERLDVTTTTSAMASPAGPAYRLEFNWAGKVGDRMALSLFGQSNPVLSVQRTDDGYAVTALREAQPSIAGECDFAMSFAISLTHGAPLDIDVFVDHGLVEIGLANGLHWFSNLYFPHDPAGRVQVNV